MKLHLLVTGAGGPVAQGITRALRFSQFDIRLIAAGNSPWGAAVSAADRGVIVPDAREDSYIPAIKQICAEEHIAAVFAGTAPDALKLSQAREELRRETNATVMLPEPETLMLGSDRWSTVQFLKAHGLNYPVTVAAGDRNAVVRMVSACGYPVIVKPRMAWNSETPLVAADEETLEFAIRRPKGLLVQEHLGGDEYDVGIFLKRDGSVAGSIAARQVARTDSAVVEEVEDFPGVRSEAERVALAVKSPGLYSVKVRIAARGPVPFSITPGFSAAAGARAALGFNEVEAAIWHFLTDEEVCLSTYKKGIFVKYSEETLVSGDCLALPNSNKAGEPVGETVGLA
jgi:carbamoyl-phosphate synthase large subunit